jgi:hypothetical protein
MSGQHSSISEQWKLILRGRPSEIFRHLVVLSLTGLSLIVWGATVIGGGLLGGESRSVLGPQSVSAAAMPAAASAWPDVIALQGRLKEEGPAASLPGRESVGMPPRDPFEAPALHFGQVVSRAAAEVADPAATEAAEAERAAELMRAAHGAMMGTRGAPETKDGAVLSAPLKLDLVMAGSGGSVAMINGQTFRVGDVITVRVGEQVIEVTVLQIQNRSVELGAGDDRITLRMVR